MKRTLYIILGSISAALGTIGTVVPLLPTVPFYLLATICFAKSSEKLHTWFTSTKLYKENLESYFKRRDMTWKVKLRIMAVVSVQILVAFLLMRRVPVGRLILGIVWLSHMIYFTFVVKTAHVPTNLTVENEVIQK